MAFYTIKVKAEYSVVVEAENKKEANEWAEQVLPELIEFGKTYSGRFDIADKDVKISKAKEYKELLPKDVIDE
jgi:translation initiation factor 2 alpha subunit (eIF-2alpha)